MLVHTSSAANNKIQQCDGARRSDLSLPSFLAVAELQLQAQLLVSAVDEGAKAVNANLGGKFATNR